MKFDECQILRLFHEIANWLIRFLCNNLLSDLVKCDQELRFRKILVI